MGLLGTTFPGSPFFFENHRDSMTVDFSIDESPSEGAGLAQTTSHSDESVRGGSDCLLDYGTSRNELPP